MIENGDFTRPQQTVAHTSNDGRLRLSVGGNFGLFVPERINKPYTYSEPSSKPLHGHDNSLVDKDGNTIKASDFAGRGVTHLQHFSSCEPSQTKAELDWSGRRVKNPYTCKEADGVRNDSYYGVTLITGEREDMRPISGLYDSAIILWGTKITIRVENPKTEWARIAEINPGTPVAGRKAFRVRSMLETTSIADGRLLVARTSGPNVPWVEGGGVERVNYMDTFYMVNDHPDNFESCDVRLFDKIYTISYAPKDTKINRRYGFAMHPFRDGAGKPLRDGTFFGSYPWIDRAGNDLSLTTGTRSLVSSQLPSGKIHPTRCPSVMPSCYNDARSIATNARYQGRVIMGLWTNGKAAPLDNLINNTDYGLGTRRESHVDLQLYKRSADHSGWVQNSGGRSNTHRSSSLRSFGFSNANLFGSLEHRFNMFRT